MCIHVNIRGTARDYDAIKLAGTDKSDKFRFLCYLDSGQHSVNSTLVFVDSMCTIRLFLFYFH